MKNIIEFTNITKNYENFKLGEINLSLPSGQIIGLIGENGAGKTTLIKTLLKIISIDSGNIKVFGKDLDSAETSIKEDIGLVLDNSFLPELITVKDVIHIMQGIYKNWDSNLFNKYIATFNLPLKKQIKTLSKGTKKKLEIATALAHHPKLLILDEPTSGLDPVVRSEVLDIFMDFIQDEEHTILFSTHITSDLEHIADRIVFLNHGQIALNKERDEILDNFGLVKCDKDDFKKIAKEDYLSFKKNKYNYEVLVEDKSKIAKKYKNLVIDKITLEELMLLMIKGEK